MIEAFENKTQNDMFNNALSYSKKINSEREKFDSLFRKSIKHLYPAYLCYDVLLKHDMIKRYKSEDNQEIEKYCKGLHNDLFFQTIAARAIYTHNWLVKEIIEHQ